jgi:hypothetical protein
VLLRDVACVMLRMLHDVAYMHDIACCMHMLLLIILIRKH